MRPPYIGLLAKVPFNRWTGEPPSAEYLTELAAACRKSADPLHDLAVTKLLFSDVTGWAFTRSNFERSLTSNTCWSPLRRRRMAIILNHLPLWPFEPTPTGWGKDGFPKEISEWERQKLW